MTWPTKTGLVAPPERFSYTAKLWEMPASWLSKFTVTDAPAGTVIVLMLNAMLCATRLIVTLCPVPLGVGVTAGVGVAVVVGVTVAVTVGEGLVGDGDVLHAANIIAITIRTTNPVSDRNLPDRTLIRFIIVPPETIGYLDCSGYLPSSACGGGQAPGFYYYWPPSPPVYEIAYTWIWVTTAGLSGVWSLFTSSTDNVCSPTGTFCHVYVVSAVAA